MKRAPRKGTYITNRHTYEKRREELRKQFPNWKKGDPAYRTRIATINKTIKRYGRSINLITKKETAIKELAAKICDFMHIRTLWIREPVRGEPKGEEAQKVADARKLLCKWAIDRNMGSRTLADYLRCNTRTPYQMRKRFAQQLPVNARLNKLWQDFKQYMLHN